MKRFLDVLKVAAVTAMISVSPLAVANATDVPLPCDPVDCPPVPIVLPGCDTCPTDPAPDTTE